MKDILNYLCYEVPVRRNSGTKVRLLAYLKDGFEKIGLRCKLWRPYGTRMVNLVIGDLTTAETVILTGYDTPKKIFLPHYRYYPLDSRKNTRNERISLVVQLLCTFLLVVGSAAAAYSLSLTDGWYKTPGIVLCCLTGLLVSLGTRGIPNKNNLNKNSAALALTLKFLQRCDIETNRVAVILLDHTADSYQGYNAVKVSLKDGLSRKNIVILEALAEGKTNYMATNVKSSCIREQIIATGCFEIATLNETEQVETLVGLFDRTYYFFCGERENNDIVVKGTRSGKDRFYVLENMEHIYHALRSCFK